MTVHKRYAWARHQDGRCWLYAADHRALAALGRHPRPLHQLGISRRISAEVRALAASLRRRARLERRFHCGGARPVVLLITPSTGDVTDVCLYSDSWRELALLLKEVA
ncbi:MAG: hypothetical protein ABIW19_14560 [Vicinamibacterales bacterium]